MMAEILSMKDDFNWLITGKQTKYLPVSYKKATEILRAIRMGKIYPASFLGVDASFKYVVIVDMINTTGIYFYNTPLVRVRFILGNFLRFEMYNIKSDKMLHANNYNTKDVVDVFFRFATIANSKGFIVPNSLEAMMRSIFVKDIVTDNNVYDYVEEYDLRLDNFEYDGGGFVSMLGPNARVSITNKTDGKFIVSFYDTLDNVSIMWLVDKDRILKLYDKIKKTYLRWNKYVFGSDKFVTIMDDDQNSDKRHSKNKSGKA